MRRLYRSKHDRIIAGICGGIGRMFRIDPTIIRLVLIFLCILTAFIPVLIVYFISCLIIPLEPSTLPAIEIKRFYRSNRNRVFAGICGGLSEMLKIDPSVLQIAIVIITLITGFVPLTVAYIVGWIIIPEKPSA